MEQNDHKFRYSSSRIESLTDGIFAFAMTLLVLNLSAPVLHGAVTNQELTFSIEDLYGKFFSFLLSFFLLAAVWGVHHRQFSFIKEADSKLMWINMVRLLFVIMIPFSSVLIGNYSELPIAAFFFSINIFLLCVTSYVEWRYACTHDMVEGISEARIAAGNTKNLVPIAVSGIASICALFMPEFSLWLYALIPLAYFLLRKIGKII